MDLLSVVVEVWCQHHYRLNQHQVEKGLNDLAEHFAVISQGMEQKIEVLYVRRIRSNVFLFIFNLC